MVAHWDLGGHLLPEHNLNYPISDSLFAFLLQVTNMDHVLPLRVPWNSPHVFLYPHMCVSVHQSPGSKSWSVPIEFLTYGPHLINAYWNKLNLFIPAIDVLVNPSLGITLCCTLGKNNVNTNVAFIKLPGEQGWCGKYCQLAKLTCIPGGILPYSSPL